MGSDRLVVWAYIMQLQLVKNVVFLLFYFSYYTCISICGVWVYTGVENPNPYPNPSNFTWGSCYPCCSLFILEFSLISPCLPRVLGMKPVSVPCVHLFTCLPLPISSCFLWRKIQTSKKKRMCQQQVSMEIWFSNQCTDGYPKVLKWENLRKKKKDKGIIVEHYCYIPSVSAISDIACSQGPL